ncbi:hypothetical protein [Halarcobacter bivalviorum]|uniref:glutamine--fructose-6-phosphate transaminase (isomerizing) n=1 Tax=Halarcobacter bivalviorum TaxID=663364 RepID=A0AAX2AAS7_9BACT|nr:hypothetical protein [Halarcobacter bivalviorum]AXH11882.1 N-acetyl sugar amidotransferase [Halarcobacter bivalviorum]RXK11004.1 hypothetical protein CRV05_01145 [Halarcobacter bivalviorum]
MCGIFGFASNGKSIKNLNVESTINNLYKLSETRGKEASGLITIDSSSIKYIKDSISPSKLIKRDDYKKIIKNLLTKNKEETVVIIGHSRLVTNGEAENNDNNQPVDIGNIVGVHNGIITNESQLWEDNKNLIKNFDIDTEVFFKIFDQFLINNDLVASISKTFKKIEGVANIAAVFKKLNILLLSTNNGSLFYVKSKDSSSMIFASEKFIIEQVIEKSNLEDNYDINFIKHVVPNSLAIFSLNDLEALELEFNNVDVLKDLKPNIELKNRNVENLSLNELKVLENDAFEKIDFTKYYEVYKLNKEKIAKLRRCRKCILPETMPFIQFDNDGVCNYCKSYKKHEPKGIEELKKILTKTNNEYDCLVTLSGGRDSCYGLHYIKEKLGLNPVTYTYDWGMVTDLARRNQMRMCGKLGVEHILVSADIKKKRDNIRKNVSAWLKNPELGMIPLFMAGDKQYFYWSNKIAEQTKVKNIILCENLLETTRFKTGFCGISPTHGTANTYTLSISKKFQMLFYYGMNFLKTPSYINSSLLDTVSAFSSYYVMEHNFINLFDYIEWNENIINDILLNNYNWEKSPDTDSTWRIGDGTAAFYNYIYYTMAGLTENDTFRSNQIREGQITRDEAIKLSEEENLPRFESMKWYLDTINLSFNDTLNTINNAPKLY